MPVRETIQIGHPALKAVNTAVTDFTDSHLHILITDMIDTMHETGLIGLAAPQLAENIQLFITQPRTTETRQGHEDTIRVFINPHLVAASPTTDIIFEGCGSVMNGTLFGPVKRPKQITIQAFDQSGKKFRLTTNGILARVIQHEYDHLQGIEFLEKVTEYRRLMAKEHYIAHIKGTKEHADASKTTLLEIR